MCVHNKNLVVLLVAGWTINLWCWSHSYWRSLLRRRTSLWWRFLWWRWTFLFRGRHKKLGNMRLHKNKCNLLLIDVRIGSVSNWIVVLDCALVEGNKLNKIHATLLNLKLLGNHALSKSGGQVLLVFGSYLLHAVRFRKASGLCIDSMFRINKRFWIWFATISLFKVWATVLSWRSSGAKLPFLNGLLLLLLGDDIRWIHKW